MWIQTKPNAGSSGHDSSARRDSDEVDSDDSNYNGRHPGFDNHRRRPAASGFVPTSDSPMWGSRTSIRVGLVNCPLLGGCSEIPDIQSVGPTGVQSRVPSTPVTPTVSSGTRVSIPGAGCPRSPAQSSGGALRLSVTVAHAASEYVFVIDGGRGPPHRCRACAAAKWELRSEHSQARPPRLVGRMRQYGACRPTFGRPGDQRLWSHRLPPLRRTSSHRGNPLRSSWLLSRRRLNSLFYLRRLISA